jgi:hypothetical protein
MGADECPIANIPVRLHQKGRPADAVQKDDVLYMRHPPLQRGEGYGVGIPEHRIVDQSANSRLLNQGGRVCDVLYDIKNGSHWMTYQIAKLDVADILALELPNENTIRKDREGNVIYSGDVYTFGVEHKPTGCMFPHCEIVALKNGSRQTHINSNAMKTTIRAKFARMAEKARTEMEEVLGREGPIMLAELSRS